MGQQKTVLIQARIVYLRLREQSIVVFRDGVGEEQQRDYFQRMAQHAAASQQSKSSKPRKRRAYDLFLSLRNHNTNFIALL
jgi:hypothetical protein